MFEVTRKPISRRQFLTVSGIAASAALLAACAPPAAAPSGAAQPTAAPTAAAGAAAATPAAAATTVNFIGDATPQQPDLDLVKQFTDQTGIKVNYINGPTSTNERESLYLQYLSAGSSDVDVYQIDVIYPAPLAPHMVDLNQYYTKDELSQYLQRIVENNTVGGKLVGIPWFTDAGILYYRSDLLEKYSYSNPPATWTEMTDMAKKIQDGERPSNANFWGLVFQGAPYEGLTCDALEWQVSWGGGTIVDESSGKVTIDNPQAASAFDMAAAWVGAISPAGVANYKEEDARNIWQQGNAAFMRNWPYAYQLGEASDSPITGKLDVAILPKGEGADARNADCLGGWQLSISMYSKQVEDAAKFVKYMAGEQTQITRAVQESYLPTLSALYDNADILKAHPWYGKLKDVFQQGAVARPSSITGDKYSHVSEIYWTEVNNVLTGQEKGDQAVKNIATQVSSVLGA